MFKILNRLKCFEKMIENGSFLIEGFALKLGGIFKMTSQYSHTCVLSLS